MAPRFKAYPQDYYQSQLFPANVFDLLPEDHECFLYRQLFGQLYTWEVEAQYSRRGQRAYPPRQVVSILIYAYGHGVFRLREIEKRCREELSELPGVERFPEAPRGVQRPDQRGREGGLSLRRGAGRFSLPRGTAADTKDHSGARATGVPGRRRDVHLVSVLSSLLPFEFGGGAQDRERRSGAVAPGHERADEEP